MRKKSFKIKDHTNFIKKFILYIVTFVIGYVLLITAVAPQKYDLNVGEIAKSDIKASKEFIDEAASDAKLKEAIEKVDKQYTQKGEVKIQAEDNINELFKNISAVSIESLDEASKVKKLQEEYNISLDYNDLKLLLSTQQDALKTIQKKCLDIIDSVYEMNIQDGDIESLEKAKNYANSKVDELGYSTDINNSIKNIISTEIKPNFFFDQEKTNEKIQEIEKNIEKIVIKKNQIIVKEGEPVTETQLQQLKELGILKEDSHGFDILYVIVAIFYFAVLFIQNYYIYKNHSNVNKNFKKVVLINLISTTSLILARFVGFASEYLIPFACAPILITLLVNSRISLVMNSVNVIVIAAIVGFDPQVIILAVVNIILGSTIIKKMQQRNDILYATIHIAIIVTVINFSTGYILSNNISEIFLNSLFVIIGTFLSGVLAIGFLPVFEATFDIVTTLKLLELSNPNSPLLKRLLMEAPGTYHHSMMVANLVELASDEVGANSVVARVGAYYHDIGKITRPYFFKENQLGKENPHDKINPTLSTLIITAHVKDGLELAKEHNLPKIIQNLIAEHHGTTLVKYFYYTVKNNSENPEEIKMEDFSYPGPIPSTKEAGILMLADSTEAAVRSISDPTKEKIEKMVYEIIEDKLQTGQLENCDLTLKDLSKIRKCFLKGLTGIYHQRIEYPTDKTRL